jgi:hypothetical protein
MLKLVFLGLLYFPAVAKEPERTVTYLRDFGPQPVPTFDKGYLILRISRMASKSGGRMESWPSERY